MVEGFLGGSPPRLRGGRTAAGRAQDGADGTAAPAAAAAGRRARDEPESPVAAGFRRYQLEVLIKASSREAYLRSLLVAASWIESLGPIVAAIPAPEELRDPRASSATGCSSIRRRTWTRSRRAVNIDQVEVKSALREAPGSAAAGAAAAAAPEPAARAAAPAEAVMPAGSDRTRWCGCPSSKLDRC